MHPTTSRVPRPHVLDIGGMIHAWVRLPGDRAEYYVAEVAPAYPLADAAARCFDALRQGRGGDAVHRVLIDTRGTARCGCGDHSCPHADAVRSIATVILAGR